MSRELTPTPEQAHAVSLAERGESMAIYAYAGTGKTATLRLIGNALKGRGLYLAFNRGIAEEARQKFPRSVTVKTQHALAFAAIGKDYRHRLERRLRPRQVIEALRLPPRQLPVEPQQAGEILLGMIQGFCQSADREVGLRHAPVELLLRIALSRAPRGAGQEQVRNIAREIARPLLPHAQRLWEALIAPDGELPISHDIYLKLWALGDPKLPGDYILYDEAQDANPVMLDVIRRQPRHQTIWVGDPHQSIYQWRGAVDAMSALSDLPSATLTQSFRFGEDIAEAANAILGSYLGVEAELRGTPEIPSQIARTPRADAILHRGNIGVIESVIMVQDRGLKPAIAGGALPLIQLLESAERLQAGQAVVSGELAGFGDWEEVREFADSEIGGDLSPFVRMVENYGIPYLLDRIRPLRDAPIESADTVVSTAHKAKGLEWSRVTLGSDFNQEDEEAPTEGLEVAEANLLYVAVTRAMNVLDCAECKPVCDALGIAGNRLEVAAETAPKPAPRSEASREDPGAPAPNAGALGPETLPGGAPPPAREGSTQAGIESLLADDGAGAARLSLELDPATLAGVRAQCAREGGVSPEELIARVLREQFALEHERSSEPAIG